MSNVPLEMMHARFKLARDLAERLTRVVAAVQSDPTSVSRVADFEQNLQALAALAAESPEAQRTRIDARERLAQMANTVSIVAQQLGFVHSWFAGVLPNVPAGPLVVVKK